MRKKEQSSQRSGLTEKQGQILAFIESVQQDEGTPPSQEEIARHFGYSSTNSVRQHLRLIERKGYLKLVLGRARGIKLISPQQGPRFEPNMVPIVGRIAAGTPILADENLNGHLALPECFGPSSGLFALQVEGDSMKDAGILSGDIAIVEKCEMVPNGSIAAVRLGEDATLKRVIFQKSKVILRAENPAYRDRTITAEEAEELHIEGRLAGIVRCVQRCRIA